MMLRLNLLFSTLCLCSAISLLSCSAAAQEEPSTTGPSAAFQDAAPADDTEGSPETATDASSAPAPQPEEEGAPVNSSSASADVPPSPPVEPAAQPANPQATESGARFSELHGGSSGTDYRNFSDAELSHAHGQQNKGGLVAMAVTGGIIVSAAAPLFLLGSVAGISCASQAVSCPGIGAFIAVTGGISLVSGGMLVGGIVGAEKRRKRRQAIEEEMRRREDGAAILIRPRMAVAVLPGGGALTFSAHY